MAKKSPKSKSTSPPIGPGRGYVAPEAGKTHSGGSGSTQSFAASQGKTNTGTPAKQYVLAGQSVSQAEYEAGIAKQQVNPSVASAPRNAPTQSFTQLATTNPYSSTVPLPTQQSNTLGVSQKPQEQGIMDKIGSAAGKVKDYIVGSGLPTKEDVGNVFSVLPLPVAGAWKLGGKAIGKANVLGKAAAGLKIKDLGVVRFAANTKTGRLLEGAVGKTISKWIPNAKEAVLITGVVSTYLGTYLWGGHDKKEAREKLDMGAKNYVFMANKALNSGDLETANRYFDESERLVNLKNEMLNPNIIEDIVSLIPFGNLGQSIVQDMEASAEFAIQQQEEINFGRKNIEQQIAALNDVNNPNNPNYWENIKAKNAEEKEQQRAEDEQYYNKIKENKQIAEEENRADDAAYWDEILKKQQEERERRRKEDIEYWDKVKKEREDNQKSKLNFGLLK